MSAAVMRAKMFYLAKRNPSCAAADWPKLWRSHPKFVARFPAIGGNIDWLNYCACVPGVISDSETRDYDGVAILAGKSHDAISLKLSPSDHALLLGDERRVFDRPVEESTFRCEERFVHGGAPGEIAVVRFVARSADMRRDDFENWWFGAHADAVVRAADASGVVRRYVQNAMVQPPPPGFAFDGIAETWFDSLDDAVSGIDIGAPADDEWDNALSMTLLSYVIYQWPRAYSAA